MWLFFEKSKDNQFDITLKELIEKRHIQCMICELQDNGILRRPSRHGSLGWRCFSVKDDRYHRYTFFGSTWGERRGEPDIITGENLTGAGRPYVSDDKVLMMPGGGQMLLSATQMESSLKRFADRVRKGAIPAEPYAYIREYHEALMSPGFWYPQTFDRTLERIHVLTLQRERYSYHESKWIPYKDVSGITPAAVYSHTLVIGQTSLQMGEILKTLHFRNVDTAETVAEARQKIVDKPGTATSVIDRTYQILLYDDSAVRDMLELMQEIGTRIHFELSRISEDPKEEIEQNASDPVVTDILLDELRVIAIPTIPEGTALDDDILLTVREYLEKGLGLF